MKMVTLSNNLVTDEFGQPVGKDYDTVIDNRPKTIVTLMVKFNWYHKVTIQ